MSPSDIAHRNKEKDAHLDLADKAAMEANTTSRTISGQLLLIAGAILTFSAAVLSSTSLTTSLPELWKGCIVASWILFGTSAFISILDLLNGYRFFRAWQKYHFAVAEKIAEDSMPNEAIEALRGKKPEPATSMYLIYAQVVLIFAGLVLLLMAISHSFL